MGGFTSNVDMRTGSPAFGTPEYVHAVIASAQIGRRLKLPVRTSAVNASPVVDAQSTYETAFSLQAAILSHSHLINHAAGWLEGGLSASLEKIVVDAELLRNWAEHPASRSAFSDDDLAVDAIKEIAAGGHFFGSAHTLARYESAFYRPLLSDWSNFENWTRCRARATPPSAPPASGRSCSPSTGRRRSIRRSGRRSPPTSRAARELADPGLTPWRPRMSEWIMNARMYAVTPEVESAWRQLLEHVAAEARRPARPTCPTRRRSRSSGSGRAPISARCSCAAIRVALEARARGPDRGADPERALGAAAQAVYRTDLIVRSDAPLPNTRGHLRQARRLDGEPLAVRLQCVPAPAACLPHARATRAVSRRCRAIS